MPVQKCCCLLYPPAFTAVKEFVAIFKGAKYKNRTYVNKTGLVSISSKRRFLGVILTGEYQICRSEDAAVDCTFGTSQLLTITLFTGGKYQTSYLPK